MAREVSGWNWCPAKRGKHNAHLYGFSHHHGSGHWSWRLFLAPSGGRGHTACAAPQIVSGFIPCGSGLLPCGSSQPRSDLVRPGLLELADQPMPTTQSTRAPSPCHWRPARRGAVPGSVTTMPSPLNVNSGSDYLRSHAIHFSLFFEAVLFLLLVVWIRTNRAGQSSLLPFWAPALARSVEVPKAISSSSTTHMMLACLWAATTTSSRRPAGFS